MQQEVKSYCRICQGFCGTVVTVEDERIIRVVGDHDDPVSRGYACFKGLQAAEQHNSEKRLLHSLRKRQGGFEAADAETLLAEAGERLKAITDEHGCDAVAIFSGTQAIFNTLSIMAIESFTRAIGTERKFNTMTIDQSAKWIGEARLGCWEAGPQPFEDADTWMMFGSNPLVSMVAGGGPTQFVFADPVKTMKRKRDAGMQLVVIDPRRTETAKFATLHLQPRPGFDAAIAASICNVILQEGWHDVAFCDEYVDGLDEFARAVEPFTPERVAEAAGIQADELRLAARIFTQAHSGMAGSGTGPDMARHSNVAEHMIQAINVICGRFPREGESLKNPGVLRPAVSLAANVKPPAREWLEGPKTVRHQLGKIHGVMMSAEISNEILEAGDERIRALVCVGGNLAVALPDQIKAEQALRSLELLIVIDPRMTATARFADYIIAPRLMYERPDSTMLLEGMFQHPFAHVTDAVVPDPPDSDLVDDWYALFKLAAAAGCDMNLAGIALDPAAPPSSAELIRSLGAGARAPFDDIKGASGGVLRPAEASVGKRTTDSMFELLADDVAGELQSVLDNLTIPAEGYRLIVRRHREVMNSLGTDFDANKKRFPGNIAFMNPLDMSDLGLTRHDLVDLIRNNRSIRVKVRPDKDLRSGVISVSHAWAGTTESPFEATNALVSNEEDIQSINHMPIMTGIPVVIRPVNPSTSAV